VGVTPEARTREEAFGGRAPRGRILVEPGALAGVYRSFVAEKDEIDLVVSGTPHLSIFEVRDLAERLRGRRVHPRTRLLLTTNAQVKATADRLGLTQVIEAAGGTLLAGPCYYIMTPRELAQRYGFRTLVTDSAKLANIIPASGYNAIFRPTADCVEAAVTGRLPA
jgi:predicted aconitase